MSRRVLMPASLALLSLLALVACARPGSDPAEVARAVNATLTASAPRVDSSAAAPDVGATVEALVTREAARASGATEAPGGALAPRPSPQAVEPPAGPTPVNTPAAWHEYADPAGVFTLLYPDTWKIASQLANRVTFSFEPNGVANVDVIDTADVTENVRDALGSPDGIARYAAADQAGSYVIGSVEKGAWSWEPEGNYALLNVNDYGLSVQWLYVAIPRDKSHAVLAKVALVNGQVTQEQRETLGKILASVQPAGIATPAPQAQATAAPTQAPTQASPTQAPTAQVQSQPTQAPPAPGQPKGPPQVTTDQSVNLRSGPGTRYMVKAISQPGQKYDLVGQNQEGTWYQLCCVAGEKLWISKLVAIVSGNATSIPIVEAPANPTPAPAAEATPTAGP